MQWFDKKADAERYAKEAAQVHIAALVIEYVKSSPMFHGPAKKYAVEAGSEMVPLIRNGYVMSKTHSLFQQKK